MSLGIKRATNIGRERMFSGFSRLGRGDDPLFDAEWDELVIQFDASSRQYRVLTAVQPTEEEVGDDRVDSTPPQKLKKQTSNK